METKAQVFGGGQGSVPEHLWAKARRKTTQDNLPHSNREPSSSSEALWLQPLCAECVEAAPMEAWAVQLIPTPIRPPPPEPGDWWLPAKNAHSLPGCAGSTHTPNPTPIVKDPS